MDFKTSRREKRLQPDGPAEVLLDNMCELYPVFDQDDEDLIVDVEVLDGDREELLDRAMFALVKQRGLDPLDLNDGVQWAEHVLGEVVAPVILQQIGSAVSKEGPGVSVIPETIRVNGESMVVFTVKLAA
jgi:hypothetical protein